MALVQSALGGNISGTNTSPFTLTTTPGNFGSATTAGNLLILVAYAFEHSHTVGGFSGPSLQNPTTAGITWIESGVFNGWSDAGPTNGGRFHIWYAANAPSIPNTTTTTVQGNIGGAGVIDDMTVEFA